MRTIVTFFVGFAALLGLLCGCSTGAQPPAGSTTPIKPTMAAPPTGAASCPTPHGLGLILGVHQNVPAPQLSSGTVCQLKADIAAGHPVFLVVADSQPHIEPVTLVPVTGGTAAGRASRIDHDVTVVEKAITSARPTQPGADDYAALAVAADEAHSLGLPHAQLVLMDSGLDDRGQLDFTQPGLIAAQPADVVAQLKSTATLLALGGFPVALVGVGYTSPPQSPVPAAMRTNLTSIWSAVLRAAGSPTVTVDPDPVAGPAVATRLTVKAVPVPASPMLTLTPLVPIVFDAQSPVSFVADTADFLDPAGAVAALTPIGQWLAADPHRSATVVGTTMNIGPLAGQQSLSQLRAAAAAKAIVAAGAAPTQLTVQGVGSNFAGYVRPDTASDGTPLPAAAVQNRSVRITLSAPGR